MSVEKKLQLFLNFFHPRYQLWMEFSIKPNSPPDQLCTASNKTHFLTVLLLAIQFIKKRSI